MPDPNPLAHRFYLADVERAARTRATARRPLRPAATAARRLLLALRRREPRRA